jgi:hypothetical protein
MRRLAFNIAIALLTFGVGVAIASLLILLKSL